MLNKIKTLTKKGGFTLMEMLVVVAIFGILSAILMFNYGNFSDSTLSTNIAYEVALQIREAQVFGLGVRGSGSTFSDSFDNAYGVYVNVPVGSDSNTVIFFLDANTDTECDGAGGAACSCSGDPTDECVDSKTLPQGIKFTDLRVYDGVACKEINSLAVSFKRPNPDALIRMNGDPTAYQAAQIEITAPRSGDKRYVIVRDNGQISVSRDTICSV